MDYFPAFLNLKGKSCLLVGGGSVASRKADSLLAAGARLTVVAPELAPKLKSYADLGQIMHRVGRFRPTDLIGHWLVVNASDDEKVSKEVFAAANDAGVFCNSVDDTARCSYVSPAIVDRSPVIVAVSSGGTAPLLARKIRAQIETILPARLGQLADLAAEWRDRVKYRINNILGRRRFWEQVFDGAVSDDALAGRLQAASRRSNCRLPRAKARKTRQDGKGSIVRA